MDAPKNSNNTEQQKSEALAVEKRRDFFAEIKALKDKMNEQFSDLQVETQGSIDLINKELASFTEDDQRAISTDDLIRLDQLKARIIKLEAEFNEAMAKAQATAESQNQPSATENTQRPTAEPKPEEVAQPEDELSPENKELRKVILKALEAGLEILRKLPEAEQSERIKWVIKSVEDAKNKAEVNPNLMFDVGAQGKNQAEGIPVDDLIEELQKIIADKKVEADKLTERKKNLETMRKLAERLKKEYEATLDEIGRDQPGMDQEHQPKTAWHRVFNNLKDGVYNNKIRKLVNGARKLWAQEDAKKSGGAVDLNQAGTDYEVDSTTYSLQTGEALRQVTEQIEQDSLREFDQERLDKIKNELKKIEKIIETLQVNSKGYFEIRPDMTGEDQHWRTELEAKLVSLDLRSTGDLEKDYELAMEAMEKRREIVLPAPAKKVVPINSVKQITYKPVNSGDLVVQPIPEEPPIVRAPRQIEYKPLQIGYDGPGEPPVTDDLKQIEWDPTKHEIIKRPEVTKKKERRGIISDVSKEADRRAWDEANRVMLVLQNPPTPLWKRTLVRLGEKGYLNKFHKEALAAIETNNNLGAQIDEVAIFSASTTKSEKRAQSEAQLDAVVGDFMEQVNEADERGETVTDPGVNSEVAALFADYATSAMTREQFDQEFKTRVIPEITRLNKKFALGSREIEAKGLMYATNLFEMAQNYRQQFEKLVDEATGEFGKAQKEIIKQHIKGELALDIELSTIHQSLRGSKSEHDLTFYEKFVDKMQDLPYLGRHGGAIFANPLVYATIGCVGMGIATKAKMGVMRTGVVAGSVGILHIAPYLAPLLVGGALGGAFTGIRRRVELERDRSLVTDQTVLGKEYGPKAKISEKLQTFNYDIKNIEVILQGVEQIMAKGTLTPADEAFLADTWARLETERERNVDLIGVSKEEGNEFGSKIMSMNELKVALKNLSAKFAVSPTDSSMRTLIDGVKINFDSNIDSNDQEFKKYKRGQGLIAAAYGAVGGVAAGAIGQYVFHEAGDGISWATSKVKEVFGYAPEVSSGPKMESALEHLYHWWNNDVASTTTEHLKVVGDSLVDANGKLIMENLPIDPNTGKIPDDLLNVLRQNGVIVNEVRKTTTGQVSVMSQVMEGLSKHARADWHDEPGKRMSSFFGRLIEHEGKQQMFYLNKDTAGNVVVDASKILENLTANAQNALKEFGTNPDGSVDSKLVDVKDQLAQWVKSGELAKHLKVAIFPTEGANKAGLSYMTESADGSGKINLGETISKLFTSAESLRDGHMPFRFGEIRIEVDGVSHVLATVTGQDINPSIVTDLGADNYTYTFDAKNPVDTLWEVPPVAPFVPRWKPEQPIDKERKQGGANESPNDGGSGGGISKTGKGEAPPDSGGVIVKGEVTGDKKTIKKPIKEGEGLTDIDVYWPEGDTGVWGGFDEIEEEANETEEKKRPTLDELAKELKLEGGILYIEEKQKAREWLLGLTKEEIEVLKYNNESLAKLKKLVNLSYLNSNGDGFFDAVAEVEFDKLAKKMEKLLVDNPELKNIFSGKEDDDDIIDITPTSA